MHPGPTSRTIPSQPGFLNRARGPGGGAGRGTDRGNRTPAPLSVVTTAPHFSSVNHPPGGAYYKLLPVTLSFNSPDPLPLSLLPRLLRFSARRRREAQWISRRLESE
jgi:hypothetical protein